MIVKRNDSSVHRPQTSHTFIAIECYPALPTTIPDPLIKTGEKKFIKTGRSIAVVVVVSPSASVTGAENATV